MGGAEKNQSQISSKTPELTVLTEHSCEDAMK